jgi:hypothetical protein
MLKEVIYKGLRDFESVTTMVKNKYWTHGGSRSGAGRPHKWKHSKTKVVRLPAVFVDRLLVLAHYMDDNEGELPFISPVVFVRHGVPDSPRQD